MSDYLSQAEFIDLFDRLAKASTTIGGKDRHRCHSLRCAIQQLHSEKWGKLISSNPDSTLIYQYQADGWGATIRRSELLLKDKDLLYAVRRAGCWRHEFLLQRCIVKVRTTAGMKSAMKFFHPISLRNGGTAWHTFEVICREDNLWSYGHRGTEVSVYIFDGALYSALLRHLSAKHRIFYMSTVAGLKLGHCSNLLDLSDFCIGIKCWHHSLSNAISAGLSEVTSYVLEEDDIYISNQALVSGADELRLYVHTFALNCVDYRDEVTGTWDDRMRFWLSLDFHSQLAEFFADLDLLWDGVTLWVNSKYRNLPSRLDKIKIAIDACIHFAQWSKTRWGRSGGCSRKKVRACVVGLDAIFAMAERGAAACTSSVVFGSPAPKCALYIWPWR